jgi:Cytochrome c554 and c-prime
MSESSGTRVRRRWTLGLFMAGLLGLGVWALGMTWRRIGQTASRPLNLKSPYRNTHTGVAYVGDETCARCHAKIVDSYRGHSMGRSMALADETSTPGLDRKSGPIKFEARGLEYAVESRDGRIIHSETKRDASGGIVSKAEAAVTYAVGSGRRGKSYLIERDGFLFQSPISWYSQEKRWDLSPDNLVKSSHFERPIDPSCLFCHANRFEPAEGTFSRYKPPTFRGLSIGCERCHGPGELHIRTPGLAADGVDLTIVNPAHLDPTLREAVCRQCHLGGTSRVEPLGRRSIDYRPGLPLHEFLSVFVDSQQPGAPSKSIGHTEQMISSRCYQGSEGQLGCVSCHDPHHLPSGEQRVSYYRSRCLDCHAQRTGCSVAEVERRKTSPDDSCIQCHMPRSSLSNVAHTVETDHSVPQKVGQQILPSIIPEATGLEQPPPCSLSRGDCQPGSPIRDAARSRCSTCWSAQRRDLAQGQSVKNRPTPAGTKPRVPSRRRCCTAGQNDGLDPAQPSERGHRVHRVGSEAQPRSRAKPGAGASAVCQSGPSRRGDRFWSSTH